MYLSYEEDTLIFKLHVRIIAKSVDMSANAYSLALIFILTLKMTSLLEIVETAGIRS